MFARLKRLYDAARLTLAGLAAAVTKGWITEEEKNEIAGKEDSCGK